MLLWGDMWVMLWGDSGVMWGDILGRDHQHHGFEEIITLLTVAQ